MSNFSEEFEETIDGIINSKDVEGLKNIVFSLRRTVGIENIVYHATSLPGITAENPLLVLTYEQDWTKRYIENNYFSIDPVVELGHSGFLPVDWSEVDRTSSAAKWFFAEADKYGVGRQGITMPIRGPGGERALFTVTSNLPEADWKRRRLDYIRSFQLIGHFVHDKAVVLGGYRSDSHAPRLSRREQECLLGIIEGKVPKQIATSLSLSTSAVQLYLQSARHKLMCKSIAEAAVKYSRI